MGVCRTIGALVAALLVVCSVPLSGAVQLSTVISGLASPVFVGHAGDGSNRLFFVERDGLLWVMQPGASSATVFLDIRPSVLAGGERGLLGLAFHPQYASNGRFFVFYTRRPDGALVVARYGVSTNPNVATAAATVLLTIAHSAFANHNGGMLAFGRDGYLYVATGDGGSGNDPPNNAQNVNVLLGKLLRIDVDVPEGSAEAYRSPASNPFAGSTPGRDEIFAIGLRNPWRFSFDRATGALWVGDVGQSAREEVHSPVVAGGNYGWRVYEGTQCTNLDASLCTPQNYARPIFDYPQTGGRCSVIGGYVYRGARGTLPLGTYVYGDYCSGEVFTWNGSQQSVLLQSGMNIASFGEDEAGELYVVGLGGTIARIFSTTPAPSPGSGACRYAISPASAAFDRKGGTGTVSVSATPGCEWTAGSDVMWIRITGAARGIGDGTVVYSVDATGARSEAPVALRQPSTRSGAIAIAGERFAVQQTR